MGRSNRLEPNERKIAYLLGEREDLRIEIEKAEALMARLPQMRARVCEIDGLIKSGATFIKDDHPNWTPDHIKPLRKWIHKNPIPLGYLTKTALATLRNATEPMTCREVTEVVLRKYAHDDPSTEQTDLVFNAVQAAFAKRRGGVLSSDASWPERWWANKPK